MFANVKNYWQVINRFNFSILSRKQMKVRWHNQFFYTPATKTDQKLSLDIAVLCHEWAGSTRMILWFHRKFLISPIAGFPPPLKASNAGALLERRHRCVSSGAADVLRRSRLLDIIFSYAKNMVQIDWSKRENNSRSYWLLNLPRLRLKEQKQERGGF